ncbi:Putative aminotransferase, class-I, pyridoxal-phosphate-binding, aminotransferase, class I/classII [Septoria linicola]|uniref:Aminotransferase, class-I, pyridoxal-phosphate-binding, aminotransferase, class I/classII n=1 Tax=Septoria linicola TaxID=215465 RepID=A0A9Q9AQ52_9PEZI|nr:putative aminotransferase, class-I, pyridoxal-phosphate-binding, aminotransferase, class I/classII [Septoria linicola]USW48776.1 Putative aminotransferase, class-I, pyridoxal-phosphate-binding, aminotransferase, class I/classII [Septoria linicola]
MAPPVPFAVEQWMDEYETKCKFNIAETCCHSISINELVELSENKNIKPADLIDLADPQTYGEIRGSTALRENLSRLYSGKVGTPLTPEGVLITPGAIAANHLVLYSLLSPGDHVICHYPTYQQLYSIPESLGAEVSLWKSDPSNKWLPDFEDLKSLIKDNTKLIIINNPQNPTGQILPKSLLHKMIEFVQPKDITIMADEVYRPIFHGIAPMDPEFPPSLLSLGYKNTVVTGSMSKAYSLAGLRVGWIASRNPELIEKFASTRDYTTISVSKIDQAIAAFALGPDTIHALLGRNIPLAKANVEILEKWIVKHDEFASWTKPVAGTTAFVKFERDGKRIDSKKFCRDVQEKTGVMLLPGDVGFGVEEFKGYVRFGFVCETKVLKEGLDALRVYMRKEFDDVPLCE